MGFIEITGTFGPTGANVGSPAGFATHEANFGLGGYMQVADNTERDAITADRRSQGMAVYVNADNKFYILKDGVTNNDWVEFSGGSGGSIDITDGTTTVTGASELDLDDENFVVTAGTPNTVAEVNTAYNTSIDPATSVAINVNDLNNLTAADFVGLSTTEVLNKLLFPTLQPSYVPGPATSLTNSQTATVEIGSQVTSNLSLSLIKNNSGGLDTGTPATITSSVGGSLTLSGPTTTPEQNLQDQFGYANANNPNEKDTYTVTEIVAMPASGSINYSSSISWLQGNQLKDSTGTDSGTPIAAGTGNPSNSVNGIYPWFHFRSANPITTASMQAAIAAGNATKELSSSTGKIDVPFLIAAPGEYLAVAYPATSPDKTKFFVNVSNQGLISVIFNDPPVTAPVDSPDQFWTGVNYKIIVSNSPQQSTDSPLELRNN